MKRALFKLQSQTLSKNTQTVLNLIATRGTQLDLSGHFGFGEFTLKLGLVPLRIIDPSVLRLA